jgi:hypothetical protein
LTDRAFVVIMAIVAILMVYLTKRFPYPIPELEQEAEANSFENRHIQAQA